jgi:hypothetical protein
MWRQERQQDRLVLPNTVTLLVQVLQEELQHDFFGSLIELLQSLNRMTGGRAAGMNGNAEKLVERKTTPWYGSTGRHSDSRRHR